MAEGALDIGTLSGRIELEDRLSNVLSQTELTLAHFDERIDHTGASLLKTAGGFSLGELAVQGFEKAVAIAEGAVEKLFEITLQGSKAADIAAAYDRMTAAAGHYGDTLLGKLRDATHGTISDYDLMVRMNENLAAGLTLTDAQFVSMAKGAYALHKSSAEDTAAALERVSDAMVTGRTRGIALLVGKIDLTAAEDRFAEKLHTTTAHLTEQGKLQATQETILQRLDVATNRIGETQVSVADKVQQAKVQWQNLEDQMGEAIAKSPVIAAGIQGIEDALAAAFGGKQKDLVKSLAVAVDDAAIEVLRFGKSGVAAAAQIGQSFNATKVLIGDTAQGIDSAIYAMDYAQVKAAKHLKSSADYETMGRDLDALGAKILQRTKDLAADKQAEADWAHAGDAMAKAIDEIQKRMIAARDAARGHADSEGELTDAEKHAAAATDDLNAKLAVSIQAGLKAGATLSDLAKEYGLTADQVVRLAAAQDAVGSAGGDSGLVLAQTKDEAKKYAEAMQELQSVGVSWEATVASMDQTTVASIKHYLDAGLSQGTLATAYKVTAAQIEAVKKARDAEIETAKVDQEVADQIAQRYAEYSARKADLEGTDGERMAASVERDYDAHVAELQKKGITDQRYYDQLEDLRNKDYELTTEAQLLQDTKTRASLEARLAGAREYYEFMLQHADQYRDVDIANQEQQITELETQRDHWNDLGGAIDADAGKVEQLTAGVMKMSAAYAAMVAEVTGANQGSFGGSWEVTKESFGASLQAAHGAAPRTDVATAMAEMGYSYGEILAYGHQPGLDYVLGDQSIQAWVKQHVPQPTGARIPGFAEGGVADFGPGTLAVLHGPEKITPLEKAGAESPITNHFYINGTGAEVARVASAEIMRQLKSRRQFGRG